MALILAVAFDEKLNGSIKRAVGELAHRSHFLTSVQEARFWLSKTAENPALFIVDVGLKAFQGLEFARELKTTEKWQNIPLLVQTMKTSCDYMDICDGSILKPYPDRELVQQVRLMIA